MSMIRMPVSQFVYDFDKSSKQIYDCDVLFIDWLG